MPSDPNAYIVPIPLPTLQNIIGLPVRLTIVAGTVDPLTQTLYLRIEGPGLPSCPAGTEPKNAGIDIFPTKAAVIKPPPLNPPARSKAHA